MMGGVVVAHDLVHVDAAHVLLLQEADHGAPKAIVSLDLFLLFAAPSAAFSLVAQRALVSFAHLYRGCFSLCCL